MKFVCSKDSILKEISVAQDIISNKNTITILSNVLLDTHDNQLIIRATDLKVGFETSIPVETHSPGSTTIFCGKLLGVLRSLPDGEVEFELQDMRLDIRPLNKKIDFQLKSIAGDKFPELQQTTEGSFFELPQRDVVEMIEQTIFAVSDDETRYFMNGVFMEKVDGKLVMVGTDGRRLSFIGKEIADSVEDFDGIIIPPKVLNVIRKLSTGEGSLSLAVTENNLFVRIADLQVFSNLIEGQFPKYSRVIPESQEYEIIVKRTDIEKALSRVSVLIEQKSLRVDLTVNDSALLVSSEESDFGIAREEIECRYEGPEMKLALNYRYLLEPLRVISDEEVALRFTDTKKAISLEPVEEQGYVHIIAPMYD